MQVEQKEMMYEGKGKKLFNTSDENLVIAEFKDDLTDFNAETRGTKTGKRAMNCKITTELL